MALAAAFDLRRDELLYSALARHVDSMRYPRQRAALYAAFGCETVAAVVDLPSRLDALATRIVHATKTPVTGRDVIFRHTLWPYYAWCLSPARAIQVEALMRGDGGAAVHNAIGLRASSVSAPARLQYCEDCVREDRIVFGTAHWRRLHQAPGVLLCPHHVAPLRESVLRRTGASSRLAFVSLERAARRSDPLVPGGTALLDHAESLVPLAHDIEALLSRSVEDSNSLTGAGALGVRERVLLARAGFVRSSGRLRLADLHDAFLQFYSGALLRLVGSPLPRRGTKGGVDDWLVRLARWPERPHHPLRHLLLLQFLGTSGMTVCVSPATPTGNDHRLIGLPIGVNDRSTPAGTATARESPGPAGWSGDTCGQFGREWLHRLTALVRDDSVSLREIARQLDVEPKTVQRHARRLGLWRAAWRTWDQCEPGTRRLHAATQTRSRHRRCWLDLRQRHPDAALSELRVLAPSTYSYLYRYDAAWLATHRPRRRRPRPRARVDWPLRDGSLLGEARRAVRALRDRPGRPKRIFVSSIAREMMCAALVEQHAAQLPLTTAYIHRAAESDVTYGQRKLRWLKQEFSKTHETPARWVVIRAAGFTPRMAVMLAADIDAVVEALRRPTGYVSRGA